MKPVLVFDIETIPDVPGLRRLHDLDPALSDAEVAEMAFQQCRVKSGNDFLPHHLQRIAVISCALRSGEDIRVWSLAEPEQSEAEIIQRFFDGVEKFTPQIASWMAIMATVVTSSGTTTSAATTHAISISWICWPCTSRAPACHSMRWPS